MRKYTNVIADHNGNVIAGATVTVLDSLGASATVYSSNVVGANANPLTTGADGSFSFYAKDGTYSLTITKTGVTTQTVTGVILQETTGLAVMGGYGITTSGDQAALLNAALVSINAAGAGVLKLTGNITVNSAITLQSNVGLDLNGFKITWGGSTTAMFTSSTAGTLQNVRVFGGSIDCATASQMFQLFSPYHVAFKDLVCASTSLVNFIFDVNVNTSGTTNPDGNYNAAFVTYENVVQTGTCGTFWRGRGNSTTQVVTLVTFKDCQAESVAVRGWDYAKWTDSIAYAGCNRAAITANNAVGVELNSDTPGSNLGVYGIHFGGRFMVDSFGSLTGRVGMKLGFCKQITGTDYFNVPAAEGGQFSISASALTYDIHYANADDLSLARRCDPTTQGLWKSGVAVSCPADTTDDTLATISIPANAMAANGMIRVSARFSATNSANTKDVRIKFGGTTVCTKQYTTETTFFLDAEIWNRNATNSQFSFGKFGHTSGYAALTPVTSAIDTTAIVTILITGQKQTSGETLTLNGYTVELLTNGA